MQIELNEEELDYILKEISDGAKQSVSIRDLYRRLRDQQKNRIKTVEKNKEIVHKWSNSHCISLEHFDKLGDMVNSRPMEVYNTLKNLTYQCAVSEWKELNEHDMRSNACFIDAMNLVDEMEGLL